MDSQILLNVNFCSEVHTNLIEKNEKSVYVRAGYSLGGLRKNKANFLSFIIPWFVGFVGCLVVVFVIL